MTSGTQCRRFSPPPMAAAERAQRSHDPAPTLSACTARTSTVDSIMGLCTCLGVQARLRMPPDAHGQHPPAPAPPTLVNRPQCQWVGGQAVPAHRLSKGPPVLR